MKEKWNKLAAFLGLTAFVMSADGAFMSEGDIDKMEAIRANNEALEASIATLQKEKEDYLVANVEAVSIKDAEITRLTAENSRVTNELDTANASIAKLNGTPTIAAGAKSDPDLNASKKKLSTREKELEMVAAEFRGETYIEQIEGEEEVEEIEEQKEK